MKKNLKKIMLEKYIRIYQKKRNKNWAWKKIQKINKRERVHERILKASFKQWVVKREDNNEVKNIGVDVVTNFIKDNVESFSDAKFCTDDDDSEENRILGYK